MTGRAGNAVHEVALAFQRLFVLFLLGDVTAIHCDQANLPVGIGDGVTRVGELPASAFIFEMDGVARGENFANSCQPTLGNVWVHVGLNVGAHHGFRRGVEPLRPGGVDRQHVELAIQQHCKIGRGIE